MSAEQEIRAAMIAGLRGDSALSALINRVFDGPPAKASVPYVVVGECSGTDWSTKDVPGRELRLAFTIVDEGETPARIGAIMPRLEAAAHAVVMGGIAGWDMGSFVLVRSRLVASAPGKWSAVMDYRLRVLSVI
jgi:Protein of unknown function (DUF3168)